MNGSNPLESVETRQPYNGSRTTVPRIIKMLMLGRCSIGDMRERLQLDIGTVSDWVHCFYDQGLIRIADWRRKEDGRGGRWVRVWEWQTSPFALEDSPVPE